MKVSDFLAADNISAGVAAADKQKLLNELAQRAGPAVGIPADRILSELCKREDLGSTGVGGGVAIPHARFHQLAKPFGVLLRLKKAIDFDAVDGKPVDTIILLLLPEDSNGGDQLSALACIARKLRDPADHRGGAGRA